MHLDDVRMIGVWHNRKVPLQFYWEWLDQDSDVFLCWAQMSDLQWTTFVGGQ